MSLFLGKIHYWLFNKILWFEELEKEIYKFADEKGLPVEQWKRDIFQKYGAPTEEKPLEEIIDTNNIHGWLQNKINSAEGRQAELITNILKTNTEYISDLEFIFGKQGEIASKEYIKEKEIPQTPAEIYNAINDYILEGMPCDRVNRIEENNEVEIRWIATRCIHYEFWNEVGGDVNNFYRLRDKWITCFVNKLNSSFKYIDKEMGAKAIVKL